MKCGYFNIDERIENRKAPSVTCDNEATHNQNCTFILGVPVCAEHKCRCSVPLKEKPVAQPSPFTILAALVELERAARDLMTDTLDRSDEDSWRCANAMRDALAALDRARGDR